MLQIEARERSVVPIPDRPGFQRLVAEVLCRRGGRCFLYRGLPPGWRAMVAIGIRWSSFAARRELYSSMPTLWAIESMARLLDWRLDKFRVLVRGDG